MNNISKLAAACALVMALGASTVAFGESTGRYIDDATITAKVKAAILEDMHLKGTSISVTTDHGNVELSGNVDTMENESQAVKDANRVEGVKSVKDLIVIKGMRQEDQSR
jgi:osmotically-inducible protein OsmY